MEQGRELAVDGEANPAIIVKEVKNTTDGIVIIVSYAFVSSDELASFQPKVAIMNQNNEIEQLIEQGITINENVMF